MRWGFLKCAGGFSSVLRLIALEKALVLGALEKLPTCPMGHVEETCPIMGHVEKTYCYSHISINKA